MSDVLGLGNGVPWWALLLMLIGLIALVGVLGALFLPNWPSPAYSIGFDADPGSDGFAEGVATFLNDPLFRVCEATLVQIGDAFYPPMLQAIRDARDAINCEAFIFEPDEI